MKLDPRMRTQNVRDAEPIQPTRQGLLDAAAIGTSPVPIVGDAMGLLADANMYATDPSSRTPVNYGLSAAGALLPWVPPAAATLGAMHVASKGKGAAPKGPGRKQAGIFGGLRANKPDLEDLKQAKRMMKDGKSRDDIWMETGWYPGPDGKWRFEIDDSNARLKDDAPGGLVPLGDMLEHKELYQQYPRLADTRVDEARGGSLRGMYLPDPETAEKPGLLLLNRGLVPNKDERKSVLLHELQHAVQDYEGLLTGSSPNQFIGSSTRPPDMGPYQAYRHTFGEVESRNTQARRNLNELARRAAPPWSTYDVDEPRVFTDYDRPGGPRKSANPRPGLLSPIRRDAIDAEDVSHEITLPPSVGMTELHNLTSPQLPGARLVLARQHDNFEPLLEVEPGRNVPKGTGVATAMYVRGLDMAKDKGVGWVSDMASPQAQAIYERLRKAGVPFRQVEGRYEISSDELADVDFDQVEDALARNAG